MEQVLERVESSKKEGTINRIKDQKQRLFLFFFFFWGVDFYQFLSSVCGRKVVVFTRALCEDLSKTTLPKNLYTGHRLYVCVLCMCVNHRHNKNNTNNNKQTLSQFRMKCLELVVLRYFSSVDLLGILCRLGGSLKKISTQRITPTSRTRNWVDLFARTATNAVVAWTAKRCAGLFLLSCASD